MTTADQTKSGLGVAGWFASVFGFAVAVATFDPHLTNFELISYLLQAFLPELVVISTAALSLVAYRAGVLRLIGRHKGLSAVISIVVVAATLAIVDRQAARAENASAEIKGHGEPSTFRVQLGAWRRLADIRYSRAQTELFRTDMQLRAEKAFAEGRMSNLDATLQAASESLGGYGRGAEEAKATENFVKSRELYLANMRARAISAQAKAPLSPLTLYLLRALANVQPYDRRAAGTPARTGSGSGGRFGRQGDDPRLRTWGIVGATTRDAASAINRISEVRGDIPGFIPGQGRREWCKALRSTILRHSREVGEPLEVTARTTVAGANETAAAIWSAEGSREADQDDASK